MRSLTWKWNALLRKQKPKDPTPSILSIDSQSVKKAPFVQEQTGIDGNKKVNGRKRSLQNFPKEFSQGVLSQRGSLRGGPSDKQGFLEVSYSKYMKFLKML